MIMLFELQLQVFSMLNDPTLFLDCFQHDSFLDIRSRDSPAITIVWTYRDKQLVNLPWNLLVEGDCIVLGPSEVAPAHVRQVSSFLIHHRLLLLRPHEN